jgi:hypothetical protein
LGHSVRTPYLIQELIEGTIGLTRHFPEVPQEGYKSINHQFNEAQDNSILNSAGDQAQWWTGNPVEFDLPNYYSVDSHFSKYMQYVSISSIIWLKFTNPLHSLKIIKFDIHQLMYLRFRVLQQGLRRKISKRMKAAATPREEIPAEMLEMLK